MKSALRLRREAKRNLLAYHSELSGRFMIPWVVLLGLAFVLIFYVAIFLKK